ncbi:MarR family winged helix-turn-helix transcriptional regulator [Sporanaerobacter sp. PP17-6a]|uniref:MarR family winged helix-turn-helix transcriptional regulator n=1 Tax=Sporanaerobacter sp. PP17-6a TaxID=1891289 RepID=UPI00089FD71B|nr:MarR family winged helix-turn-helix transcriptional regulator [Sporanaerobacter sp. PP17-6a]MBE6082663.1 winged helix-turn-helix transcriptional regulator [Tissierellaceae bacterium]SCL94646.1 putative HTH-type transcriptional regulator YusO [Sporanaerobacter sp. PP17-6a]
MSIGLHMALVKTSHAQKNKTRPGMTKIGLSPGQPKILTYVSEHNCCMQKEIAMALDIEPATVSQLLNNMAQNGLIKRSAPAERKRAESVSITEKGQSAYKKWLCLCKEIEEVSLQGFTKEEQEQFLDYLSRMYYNLTDKILE